LRQQVGQRRVAGDVDLEAAQGLLDRVLARVDDRRDLAAAEVLQEQRFQDVVDLVGLEPQLGGAIAAHGPGVLKVTDAGAEEDDGLHGDFGLSCGSGTARRLLRQCRSAYDSGCE